MHPLTARITFPNCLFPVQASGLVDAGQLLELLLSLGHLEDARVLQARFDGSILPTLLLMCFRFELGGVGPLGGRTSAAGAFGWIYVTCIIMLLNIGGMGAPAERRAAGVNNYCTIFELHVLPFEMALWRYSCCRRFLRCIIEGLSLCGKRPLL